MVVLKTLLSMKAAEKIADWLDSKNRLPGDGYDERHGGRHHARRGGKVAPRGRTVALATAATSIARRNPKLLMTVGAAGAAVYLASYLVKRKQQQKTTYY